jgi:hypothetical protein
MSNEPQRSLQQVSAEGIQQILAELQKLNRRMDTLNTRLFGNPEGDAGDEGRLVVLERRTNNHSERISKLEQFRWYLLGGFIVADILFLYAMRLWAAVRAAGK